MKVIYQIKKDILYGIITQRIRIPAPLMLQEMIKHLKLVEKSGLNWVNIIAGVVILLLSNINISDAKYIFNPKIERESSCLHCCTPSGTMPCLWPLYIYIYPKNIDKMIEENPEFKKEVMEIWKDGKNKYGIMVRKLKKPNEYGNIYTDNYSQYYNNLFENPEEEIYINNCYKLWKYDPGVFSTMSYRFKTNQ